MPKFRFTWEAPRLYPQLSLEVNPGDVVELKKNIDPARFEPVAAKSTSKSKPAKADDPEVTK